MPDRAWMADPGHGAAPLAEAHGHDDVAQILDAWLNDRPGDT
jgi:hypothetical protein